MTDGYMSFRFEFVTPVSVSVEETSQGVALIKGTLLVEGMSRNGNLYTIEEMENIAHQAEGKPIHFGVKEGVNPNTGKWSKNLHDDSDNTRIGKIISTTLDWINRKITFIAEVVNTPMFPDIINKVKAGWGISIGGFVQKAKWVLNKAKQICLKIEDMVVEHVSLIEPSIIRGQDEAKVEAVNVQETMTFDIPARKHFVIDSRGIKSVEFEGF
jgi:hypothetical protein